MRRLEVIWGDISGNLYRLDVKCVSTYVDNRYILSRMRWNDVLCIELICYDVKCMSTCVDVSWNVCRPKLICGDEVKYVDMIWIVYTQDKRDMNWNSLIWAQIHVDMYWDEWYYSWILIT